MATKKYIRRRILSISVLLFLCLFVAAEPFRIANAAFNKANTMPCCAGKAAGHCESGIAAIKVPPPAPEPMCGLHGATPESDGITIVAEPVAESPHSHSQTAESSSSQPAAESASLSSSCHMDCGACATAASRQQKRERSIVLSSTYQTASVTTSSKYEDESLLLSSSDNWPQAVPRGPPARR
ncbi:MAG TPA: hypothetical protein VFI57_10405 [Pyrinomonadaceae bacterium]|nr:hypothetical protein [Pyrinomonadaceae bacterium]